MAYHLHSSSAVLNLIKLSDWIISKHLYISRRLHRLQSSTRVTLDCQGNYCHSLHKQVRQVGPDAAEPTNTYSNYRLIFRAGGAVVARPSAAAKLSLVQDQSYSSSWKAFFLHFKAAAVLISAKSRYRCSVQPWARSQRATVCVKVPSDSLWQLRAKDSIPLVQSLNFSPHLRVKCLCSR